MVASALKIFYIALCFVQVPPAQSVRGRQNKRISTGIKQIFQPK
jgi:hypothetical protein